MVLPALYGELGLAVCDVSGWEEKERVSVGGELGIYSFWESGTRVTN